MAVMRKFNEFFGLTPFEGEDEAYYADERRYDAAPAYSAQATARAYEPTIVPVIINSFDEANLIGEPFRDGDAVVFDLEDLTGSDARRVVDFAAGLCFALRGRMERLDTRVFAIVPENADITGYELKRAARLG